ncbi:MAG: hypothetical protein QOK04_545 [Solirubrobacteraceae bacterium]|jgi:hypothetical protein|nr:hypothetical protein [Solirubrobacteraceae bacterium]
MNAIVRSVPALVVAICAAAAPAVAAADPIPEGPNAGKLTVYSGTPATANPVSAPQPPRHPFMAPNGLSNLHDDAYQTDSYAWLGPLGKDMVKLDTFQAIGECASITFDSAGRLVTVCVSLAGPTLALFDPQTLDRLATFALPPRQLSGGGTNFFTSFSGGGYFYLDQHDRAVIPTTSHHIFVVGETAGPGFALERDYDVSASIPSDDSIISALPDWSGRIWFASSHGVVATVDPGSGAVRTINTGEPIGNSFAIDETGGVFIVSDGAMYRFDAAADGAPSMTWREGYANIGVAKPGQTEKGSGTTPTLMGRDYVSITDNADPMNVVVFRRARHVAGSRRVCTQPVFAPGASDTDQSLIGTDRSMVVENNFGYSGPAATQNGGTTSPGLARVDINANGIGCRLVWTSAERAPSVVPKLSLGNGLVYTYTKDPQADGSDAWYLTAIDFRTGKTVYKRLGGEGLGHNNNYAPIIIGQTGNLYVGVLGGLVMIRDRVPPTAGSSHGGTSSAGAASGLRLALTLRYRSGRSRNGRRCAAGAVTAELAGRDRGRVRYVDFSLGRSSLGRDRSAPFRQRVARGALHAGNIYRFSARAKLRGDGRVTRTRAFRACL